MGGYRRGRAGEPGDGAAAVEELEKVFQAERPKWLKALRQCVELQ
jgi:hypothetical protein